ncbi:hypothetical protein [Thiofilum flexile]|uniref:hypothetical protein n=1 Tax=Thiofilum flexile TaxID=125627 RepID=UPI00036A74BC|nr:hypothetical protein [Thiofilum flexile]
MAQNSLFKLVNLIGLALSAALLTGCESAPPPEPATTAVATETTTVAVAKPKRIKEVLVIEHVTCNPEQAQKLRAEINKREAARRAKGEEMAEDLLSQERIRQLESAPAS